ncbi:hypothetical protein PVAND_011116 [Polypedilum vanderplanki]|uniref:RING-type domain-containing protein n=1 Tax=Polypedilum vanderplanki TaxID=319348 RepID=A0A9J6CHM1_POLVA|nr:hypothetical protein PVAND_011116 [Polypedilum vanderplanki]
MLLFCNVCAFASTKDNINLFLTCGHILCKACIRPNESGMTKCQICNKIANFKELDKLPEGLKKKFFSDNINEMLQESLKIIQFQQQQEHNAFQKINKYRDKSAKLQKYLNKEMVEIKQFDSTYGKLRQRREQMQAKLAEIQKREMQQNKPQNQRYRERHTSIDSFNSSPVTKSSVNNTNSFNFTPSINQEYFPNTAVINMNRRKSIGEASSRSPFFT